MTGWAERASDSAAIELLVRLGTHAMPHGNGRRLFDHLTGVAAIASAWGARDVVRYAALFHSIYGTEIYRDVAAPGDRRDLVRATIGVDAERLAFAFGSLDRKKFGASIATMDAPVEATIATRFGVMATYDAALVRDLALLGLMNEIEQTCAPDGSPANWRVPGGALVPALVRWRAPDVPHFVMSILAAPRDLEKDAIDSYARAIRLAALGDARAAETAFVDVRDAGLFVAEPCSWLARLARRRGDACAARAHEAEALRRSAAWGTAWDKRSSIALASALHGSCQIPLAHSTDAFVSKRPSAT